MTDCACGEDWRFEAADLETGRVKAVIHPIAGNWQTSLNQVGQGTITLATRDTNLYDIWPHTTSIYILRTGGGGATMERPEVEFAGYVETLEASDNGTINLGLKSIEDFLFHRHLASETNYLEVSQNEIGADLVNTARTPKGIPLVGEAAPSTISRDRNYHSWDFKNIGEAVQQLTEVIRGPDWSLRHVRSSGEWTTYMTFVDRVGIDRDLVLASDREIQSYSMTVDAAQQATKIWAVGAGEEDDQLKVQSWAEGITHRTYPQFQAVPAWTDVSQRPTLKSHADGYIEDYSEPLAIPNITIPGFDPDPILMSNGDIVDLRLDFGAIYYQDKARIVSTSWSVAVDAPASRTYEVIPTSPASESVMPGVGNNDCEDC